MKKLKQMRQDRKLSQSQLAQKAGLNVRTLQHYEQGTKIFDNAKIYTILKIALALDCHIEDILENQDSIDMLKLYAAK